MERLFRVDTTLADDLAELYATLVEEFGEKSAIGLGDMNRTLLQTGMVHHLIMMAGLGLIDGDKARKTNELVDRVARNTIMWDLVQMSRQYWQDSSGTTGTVDYDA